jgi:hypothetical protein
MAAERDEVAGLNLVGLRRRAVSREAIQELKAAFRLVYFKSGNIREIASGALEAGTFASPEARRFLEFITAGTRGIARTRRPQPGSAPDGAVTDRLERLAITCGDPAGIGPEIVAAWLAANGPPRGVAVIGPARWLASLDPGRRRSPSAPRTTPRSRPAGRGGPWSRGPPSSGRRGSAAPGSARAS